MNPTTEEIVKYLREMPSHVFLMATHPAEMCAAAADRLEVLEAELAALKEQQRWIPVTERLPEDDEDVLVLVSGDVSMGYFNIFRGYWVDLNDDDIDVTHWMPLPEPPKE